MDDFIFDWIVKDSSSQVVTPLHASKHKHTLTNSFFPINQPWSQSTKSEKDTEIYRTGESEWKRVHKMWEKNQLAFCEFLKTFRSYSSTSFDSMCVAIRFFTFTVVEYILWMSLFCM